MILHTPVPKSKHKKTTKNIREQHDIWLKSVQSMKTSFSFDKRKTFKSTISTPKPYRRETPYIPSSGNGIGNGTKPITTISYTGTNIIGISTLHKSNAVPVFNKQDAVDIAKMRRN